MNCHYTVSPNTKAKFPKIRCDLPFDSGTKLEEAGSAAITCHGSVTVFPERVTWVLKTPSVVLISNKPSVQSHFKTIAQRATEMTMNSLKPKTKTRFSDALNTQKGGSAATACPRGVTVFPERVTDALKTLCLALN
jgi:hypothetical protein